MQGKNLQNPFSGQTDPTEHNQYGVSTYPK
jgi:hypothetical protein